MRGLCFSASKNRTQGTWKDEELYCIRKGAARESPCGSFLDHIYRIGNDL